MRIVARVAAGSVLLVAAGALHAQSIAFSRPVVVTRDVATTHKIESLLCEHPRNGRQMFGGSFVERRDSASGEWTERGGVY